MASRMSRYTEAEETSKSRSSQNKDLYRRMYDDVEYTNIEGILNVPTSDNVNPAHIRALVSRRESDRNRQIVRRNVEQKPLRETTYNDERNYDIRDILNQAKNKRPAEATKKYRSLNNYNTIFDDIVLEKTEDFKKQEEELKELIETVTSASIIDKNNNDFGDLLDELKSNTMVGDSKSIRAIVNEEINKELEKTFSTKNSNNLDQSFITNNMKFAKNDFDDLKDMNKTIKKNNNLMITIIVFIITAIVIFTVVGLIMTLGR